MEHPGYTRIQVQEDSGFTALGPGSWMATTIHEGYVYMIDEEGTLWKGDLFLGIPCSGRGESYFSRLWDKVKGWF